MAVTKQKVWTYEEYTKLDDDKRYEVIEGKLIEMAPAPRTVHQIISMNLSILLGVYVKDKKLGRIIASPIDVKLEDINTPQPDLIFISKNQQNIIKEKNISGSPDLVVEILSPSNPDHDKVDKFNMYEKFKVKEYWIVDPDEKAIEIFTLENDKYISYCLVKNNEKLKSKIFSDIELSFTNLIE